MRVAIDGTDTSVDFPDDMGEEDIQAVLRQQFNPEDFQRSKLMLQKTEKQAKPEDPRFIDQIADYAANTAMELGLDREASRKLQQIISVGGEQLPVVGQGQAFQDMHNATSRGDMLGGTMAAMGMMGLPAWMRNPAEQGAKKLSSLFKPEALQDVMRNANNPKSASTMLYMTPKEFRKLARDIDFDTPREKKRVDAIKGYIKQGSPIRDIPYLRFDIDTDGTAKITGHEGRARSQALIELGMGDELMPVDFHSAYSQVRWGSQKPTHFDHTEQFPKMLRNEDDTRVYQFPIKREYDTGVMEQVGITPKTEPPPRPRTMEETQELIRKSMDRVNNK